MINDESQGWLIVIVCLVLAGGVESIVDGLIFVSSWLLSLIG